MIKLKTETKRNRQATGRIIRVSESGARGHSFCW